MSTKKLFFPLLICAVALLFIGRLFVLQVVQYDEKKIALTGSTVKKIYTYPERGFVYDRNHKLLVSNKFTYDIKVTPNEVKPFDTLELCKLLQIEKTYLLKKLSRAKKYSRWLPSTVLSQLSKEDYAYLQEKLYRFKGFSIQKKSARYYPQSSAANILGYVNEVNDELARKNPYYKQGELVGTAGLEKQYEKLLRGNKGIEFKLRDRLNKILGPYKEGKYDTLATPGKDLILTIDLELQQYGEYLMQNKRGGIVVLEPKSGEILALVTAPSYDPNLMVGRQKSKNSVYLFGDQDNKPMLDRSLQAAYAPGSPFKLVQALVGMQEGVITPKSKFYCHHGYRYGRAKNNFMGCHCGIVGRPVNLTKSISRSCNSFYANTFQQIINKYPSSQEGVNTWAAHLNSFGLGNFLGYDLPTGRKGHIPNADFYDRMYPRKTWKSPTIISNAIGQGEIITTPIQLANMIAAIANRGYFYTPHILKKIEGFDLKDPKFTRPKFTSIQQEYFEPVIEGMLDVYKTGTAKHVQLPGVEICGKTGTVQNYIRAKGEKHELKDHSIFVAFAPKEQPKIALAVFVENGGFGSAIAAPIASLMIEKYLLGTQSLQFWEDRMVAKSLKEEYKIKQALQDLESTKN